MAVIRWTSVALVLRTVAAFWDVGTTTLEPDRSGDTTPRQSFFRWQKVEFDWIRGWYPYDTQQDEIYRRHLCVVAGISIDDLPLGTAAILNRRTLITSANLIDPYIPRQKDVRVWALGRTGLCTTPYRYRVWRIRRVLPRSANPEHWHGPQGFHTPRHDVAIIHTWDMMYIYYVYPDRFMYAYRAALTEPKETLADVMMFAGSGYEYLQHIEENYKIFYTLIHKTDIVNCERYLPKWWGKFICAINRSSTAGVPLGGPLFSDKKVVGIGCFEIRYNEDRVYVFTDLRYYFHWISIVGNYSPHEYYEYAYPQWGVKLARGLFAGGFYDGHGNDPRPPGIQPVGDAPRDKNGYVSWTHVGEY